MAIFNLQRRQHESQNETVPKSAMNENREAGKTESECSNVMLPSWIVSFFFSLVNPPRKQAPC